MPTNTPNYNLVKPSGEEFYDIAVPNENMDKIDAVLKALADVISDGVTQQELTVIKDELTSHLEESKKVSNASRTGAQSLENASHKNVFFNVIDGDIATLNGLGQVVLNKGIYDVTLQLGFINAAGERIVSCAGFSNRSVAVTTLGTHLVTLQVKAVITSSPSVLSVTAYQNSGAPIDLTTDTKIRITKVASL